MPADDRGRAAVAATRRKNQPIFESF